MRATTSFAAGALLLATAAPLVATAGPAGAVGTCGAPVIAAGNATVTCAYSGAATTWTVPPAVTSLNLTLDGAAGGTPFLVKVGLGGETKATVAVVPDTVLTVVVGGAGGLGATGEGPGAGGFGGGGAGGAGNSPNLVAGSGGGGASSVSDGTDILAVAGGGGGESNVFGAGPGAGGGTSGGTGVSYSGDVTGVGGAGGTQSGPGTGTDGTSGSGSQGGAGAPSADNVGCNTSLPSDTPGGGGGGGGYYGGAGGVPCAGGGGGSGYVAPSDTATTLTSGVNAGNGSVVIGYAVPHLTSTPNVTSVVLGPTAPPTLTDSAVLSGETSPTGTITFTLYEGATQLDSETVTVSGNGTYSTPTGYSLPTTGTVVGTYQWDATYSGDVNNSSASDTNDPYEQVTVSAAAPAIASAPDPLSVVLGTTSPALSDLVMLAFGYHPTGTLTFTLYLGSTLVDTESVGVSGNGTYFTPTAYSLPTTGTVTGTYQWDVSYAGDANNNAVSGTGDTLVTSASPTLSTTPNLTTVTLGGPSPTLTDSATLSGGYYPTGTITFTLYLGATLVDTEEATVSGNGTYSTPTGYTLPTTGTVAGTYQWDASYAGDGNNSAVSDTNNTNERTVASKANQTISFAPLPDVTFGQPPFSLSATATSGLAVAFASTTPGVCTVSGSTATILHAGTCTFVATQPGDSLWNAAPPVTRSFTVNRATMPAPTGLSVTAAAGVLTATWAPVGPATTYTCTLYFGYGNPTGVSVTSATPTCSFVGLDLSRSWGVSVVATSSTGDWTASAPAVGFSAAVSPPAPTPPARTHHAPGRPEIAVASRAGGTITIALAGRTPNGGEPIAAYEYSLDGGPWILITANAHHALVIDGLVPGRSYSVRLRALNAVGAGPASRSVTVRVL